MAMRSGTYGMRALADLVATHLIAGGQFVWGKMLVRLEDDGDASPQFTLHSRCLACGWKHKRQFAARRDRERANQTGQQDAEAALSHHCRPKRGEPAR